MKDPVSERYDVLYGKAPHPFGQEPTFLVKEAARYLQSGNAIDLGAGDGRDSTYLAVQGFNVLAVDFSKVAIERIKKDAVALNTDIKTKLADIRTYVFDQKYSLILTAFILHHLSRTEARALIQNVMDHTAVNGLNLIAAFTDKGDFYKNERAKDPNTSSFYAHNKELATLYAGWKILRYEERDEEALARRTDGSPMRNICGYLLAQNIK